MTTNLICEECKKPLVLQEEQEAGICDVCLISFLPKSMEKITERFPGRKS